MAALFRRQMVACKVRVEHDEAVARIHKQPKRPAAVAIVYKYGLLAHNLEAGETAKYIFAYADCIGKIAFGGNKTSKGFFVTASRHFLAANDIGAVVGNISGNGTAPVGVLFPHGIPHHVVSEHLDAAFGRRRGEIYGTIVAHAADAGHDADKGNPRPARREQQTEHEAKEHETEQQGEGKF